MVVDKSTETQVERGFIFRICSGTMEKNVEVDVGLWRILDNLGVKHLW